MKIKHVDHVGIVVDDLDAARDFFADLGFTAAEKMSVQGEWVERVVGLKKAKEDIIMVQSPDGQLGLELTKYRSPVDPEGIQPRAANALGLRHIAFVVEDIEATVNMLTQKGKELIGEIQTYENVWKLCYVRGPEGIIVELAEELR